MFCFAKLCCMCLSNEKLLTSVQNINKDNVKLIDKIAYCFQEDQNIIKQIMPNAFICIRCKDQIQRFYRFMINVRIKFDILRSYVTELSCNHTQKTGNLQISVDRKRILDVNGSESNEDYPDLSLIDNLKPSLEDNEIKVKIEYNMDSFEDDEENLTEDCKIKAEPEDDIEFMKTEFDYETYDLICKEEQNLENYFSSEDIKVLINSCLDDDHITSTNDAEDRENDIENIEEKKTEANPKEEISVHEEKRKKLNHFKCPFCDVTFYTVNSFSRHLTNMHTEKRFSCNDCDRTFSREVSLKRHSLQHIKNGNVKFKQI